MNVAIYIRVSTEEQAQEGYSIAAQRDRLTQFAHSQDWNIVDYYLDEAVSAKNLQRPELQRMIQDVEAGGIDVVLVLRLDRLTRSVLDLYQLLDHFAKYNTGFRSATEVYDTTSAIGRLFLTLVAALAQWERENLAERVKFGMEQMAREGKWHGGMIPFGYRYVEGAKAVLEIHPEEALIVQMIFSKYTNGMSIVGVTQWLNQNGYQKRGNTWNDTSVGYMLRNPIYTGTIRWNKSTKGQYFEVEDSAPVIVDKETFDRAQSILDIRQFKSPRSRDSDYVFTGHLTCARCGFSITSKSQSSHRYYTCMGVKQGLCDIPNFREDELEKRFLEAIQFYGDQVLTQEVAATVENTAEDMKRQAEIEQIHKELEKVKERRKKWQYLFANEAISFEDYKERNQEELEAERVLSDQLEELQQFTAQPQHSSEQIAIALQRQMEVWNKLGNIEKKTAVDLLVDKITLDVDGQKRSHKKKVVIKGITFR